MTENSQSTHSCRAQRLTAAIVAFVSVLVTIGTIWYINRPAGPVKTPTWDDLLLEAKAGNYKLCNTEELVDLYRNNPNNLLIVDARQEWEYRTIHIKGAVLFPVETTWWWRVRNTAALGRLLGSDKDRIVVFYCGGMA